MKPFTRNLIILFCVISPLLTYAFLQTLVANGIVEYAERSALQVAFNAFFGPVLIGLVGLGFSVMNDKKPSKIDPSGLLGYLLASTILLLGTIELVQFV